MLFPSVCFVLVDFFVDLVVQCVEEWVCSVVFA